jgi:uncharacterized repeat protein (TIGR03803 family)
LLDDDGNIYGVATNGGAHDDGIVYKLAAQTNTLTILATFNGANGAHPVGTLMEDSAGNLYGATSGGGASDLGTIFKIDSVTGALTTLFTFDGPNGAKPSGGLVADAFGNFYGVTINGGDSDMGTVFELTPVPEPPSYTLCLTGMGFSLILFRLPSACGKKVIAMRLQSARRI